LAITDHDITTGIPEALTAAVPLGVEVIPGVEISARYGDHELHLLGYCLDWQDPTLNVRLAQLRASRHTRNPQIIERLRGLGIDLTYEEVKALAGTESVGRPHIARALMQKGYVQSAREAFDRFLAQGKPAYVPRELPDPSEAIAWIRAAKGIPVLAHPFWTGQEGEDLYRLCKTLKGVGLAGMEVHYSTHNPRQTEELHTIAQRLDLLVTGGSDFHGLTKPDVAIGVGRGGLTVPVSLLDRLKRAAGI
jgi:hypothetical protein